MSKTNLETNLFFIFFRFKGSVLSIRMKSVTHSVDSTTSYKVWRFYDVKYCHPLAEKLADRLQCQGKTS